MAASVRGQPALIVSGFSDGPLTLHRRGTDRTPPQPLASFAADLDGSFYDQGGKFLGRLHGDEALFLPDWLQTLDVVDARRGQDRPSAPLIQVQEEEEERPGHLPGEHVPEKPILSPFPLRPATPEEMERHQGALVPLPLPSTVGLPGRAASRKGGSGDAVLELLMPGGKLIGFHEKSARQTTTTVSKQEFSAMLTKLMAMNPEKVGVPSYDGQWYKLPDGSLFGFRESTKYGLTLETQNPSWARQHQSSPEMIDNIESEYDEETVRECIQCIPGELPIDAVGFWQFVPDGRYKFGLSGENLLTFVRRCLLALLRKGARPLFGFAGPPHGWRVTERFGRRPEEIAERVIAEWLAVGAPDPRIQGPDPGQPDIIGLWFATPNFYEAGGKPAPQPAPDLESARDKWDGRTVDEWIADRLRELDVAEVGPNDPVGLWLIVPAGRYDFGLQGEVLVAFVRRTLLALLRAGAMPVTDKDTPVGWRVLEQYGTSPDEIAEAVIAEWLASGGGDPDDTVWFARPDRIPPASQNHTAAAE